MGLWVPLLLAGLAGAMRKHHAPSALERKTRIQGYIYDGDSAAGDAEHASALLRLSDHPLHVVIETPKPKVKGLRAAIQNASVSSFRRPRVIFISFDDSTDIERSSHGVPVLRSMYENAILEFPHADTYTYFNSDIAVDSSFIETADAVVRAVQKKVLRKRFLVVGRRTNIDFNSSADVSDASLVKELPKGKLFRPDAEDYFMVSDTSFRWADIPPFIVGHRGYDNWLVQHASSDPEMDAVDATETLRAIHMTDKRIGNKEGFKPSADGKDYNMKLFQKQKYSWNCSTSTSTQWKTHRSADDDRDIELVRRRNFCD